MDRGSPALSAHLSGATKMDVRQSKKGWFQECLGCEAKTAFRYFVDGNQIAHSQEESSCCVRFLCPGSYSEIAFSSFTLLRWCITCSLRKSQFHYGCPRGRHRCWTFDDRAAISLHGWLLQVLLLSNRDHEECWAGIGLCQRRLLVLVRSMCAKIGLKVDLICLNVLTHRII